MNKYVFIFHTDGPMDMSNGVGDKIMAWFQSTGSKMIDGGNPFNPKAEAHVKGSSVGRESDTASGYCIINAKDLDEAIELAKGCPLSSLPGCWLNVYETMPM